MEQPPEHLRPTASGTPVGPLLERDREISLLQGLIEQATDGGAALCLVEGPAGIGKTRLVAKSRSVAAERGMLVMSASANEFERKFPFGVIGQMFEPAIRSDAGQRLLSGAAAPASAILAEERRSEAGTHGNDPSFAMLNGLYWLTVRMAEQQPLLLAVDDLQWCDSPSLRFLTYLRSRFEGLNLLIVCSSRPAEPGSDMAALDALLGDAATVRVRPRPLSETATGSLIERRLGTAPQSEFRIACHRATGGNPLLLDELLKELAAERCRPDATSLAMLDDLGPASVTRTVFLRLRRQGPDAIAVARALAILGDGATLTAIAALADTDIDRAATATAGLARAEIVRPEPPLGFVHPLVASAVYRDVLSGDRDLLHLRAAEYAMAAGAPAGQVAGHLLRAPPRGLPWVVEQLEQAAAGASRKGAADSAVAYLERAIAEPPPPERRADLLLAVGRAEAPRSGATAAEHLRAAYSELTDPEQRANVAELLGRVLLFTGAGEEAVRIVREAAAALSGRHESLRQQLEALEMFCVLFGAGDAEAFSHLESYRTRPVGKSLGEQMLAATAAHEWMYAGGPSAAVGRLALAALDGGGLVAADSGWAATFPITTLSYADHPDAEQWWELASDLAHRRGSLLDIAAISLWHGNALWRRGELADAGSSLRVCRGAVQQWGYHGSLAQIYCDANISAVLRERGDLADARGALGRGPDPADNHEGARIWYGSRLELLLAEGSYRATIDAAEDYAARFDSVVRNPMDVPWRSLKAQALDLLGQREQAVELAAAELELARAWGAPSTLARALRVLGTIEREGGLNHLEEAVATAAPSPARLEHAAAAAALGTALRRARRPAEARGPLRTALDIAAACGAEPIADRTRTELYAAGGRPRRTALSGVESLTASERRVVGSAAEGRTNREVGEALYITPKTVAMHLSNAYRKLGVSSRRELAGELADTLRSRPH